MLTRFRVSQPSVPRTVSALFDQLISGVPNMLSNKHTLLILLITAGAVFALTGSIQAHDPVAAPRAPHCEVPCGIYDDQMRFQAMLEDTATISKSIAGITEFSASLGENPPTAKGINQTMRWVTTKDDHATNVQHIVAQYFLTQRIKPENERYVDQLKAAHAVMVAAMKCKQDADPATAEVLKNSVYDLYRAYEGKEPVLEKHD